MDTMIQNQESMVFSKYMDLYALIVPNDNMLRKINDLVDFSFVYDELKDKYCHNNGRHAIDPIRMFKYLLLKTIYDLSDVDIVERSRYDMSFKYFFHMVPEEQLNLLKETVSDDIEHLQTSNDKDTKVGHKTADSSFFGYKTHIAMNEERIITAATITTGEK